MVDSGVYSWFNPNLLGRGQPWLLALLCRPVPAMTQLGLCGTGLTIGSWGGGYGCFGSLLNRKNHSPPCRSSGQPLKAQASCMPSLTCSRAALIQPSSSFCKSPLGGALLYWLANSVIDPIITSHSCWRFGWPDYGELVCDLYYLSYVLSDWSI